MSRGEHGKNTEWARYVRSVIGSSKQSAVAIRVDVDQATISRWLTGGKPGSAEAVVRFARAYLDVTTPLEAFVAAGFITEIEAKGNDEYRERGRAYER